MYPTLSSRANRLALCSPVDGRKHLATRDSTIVAGGQPAHEGHRIDAV